MDGLTDSAKSSYGYRLTKLNATKIYLQDNQFSRKVQVSVRFILSFPSHLSLCSFLFLLLTCSANNFRLSCSFSLYCLCSLSCVYNIPGYEMYLCSVGWIKGLTIAKMKHSCDVGSDTLLSATHSQPSNFKFNLMIISVGQFQMLSNWMVLSTWTFCVWQRQVFLAPCWLQIIPRTVNTSWLWIVPRSWNISWLT